MAKCRTPATYPSAILTRLRAVFGNVSHIEYRTGLAGYHGVGATRCAGRRPSSVLGARALITEPRDRDDRPHQRLHLHRSLRLRQWLRRSTRSRTSTSGTTDDDQGFDSIALRGRGC